MQEKPMSVFRKHGPAGTPSYHDWGPGGAALLCFYYSAASGINGRDALVLDVLNRIGF